MKIGRSTVYRTIEVLDHSLIKKKSSKRIFKILSNNPVKNLIINDYSYNTETKRLTHLIPDL